MNNILYLSKYNFYIEEGKQFFIYNTVSGSIIRLSKELYYYIKKCDEVHTIDVGKMSHIVIKMLIDNRIIYHSCNEEKSYLEFMYLHNTHDDSFLSMVMLPTLKCNFRCHYCYEKEKNICLTNSSIKILKDFFTNNQRRENISLLDGVVARFLRFGSK